MISIFKDILNLFFPNCCVICSSRLVDNEEHICVTCLSEIPPTNYHKQPENKLEEVFAGRFPFVRIASYAHFVKGGSLQPIIHELKYRSNPKLGVFLGELSGKALKGSPFLKGVDYIVPVPIHSNRQKMRGYNQSLEIAKGLSLQTGLVIDSENLSRVVDNPTQTGFSKLERWSNVDGIFQISNEKVFEGKHILLIDDVVTTGSTLESCAKAILACDNTKISIFTLGSTILT